MREINHLSLQQWLRSAIPDSQQPMSPIGFLFLKLPPPPCAVLLVMFCIHYYHGSIRQKECIPRNEMCNQELMADGRSTV